MKPFSRPSPSPVTAALLLVAALAFGGCFGSPPSRFYLLTPSAAPAAEAPPPSAPVPGGPVLVVGPVETARYLDRPEVLLRVGPNEIRPADSAFWAEPLKEMVLRVLARDLGALLHTNRVRLFPRAGSGPPADFSVRIRLDRFDTDRDGRTLLEGSWTLTAKDGTSSTSRFTFETRARDPKDCASVTAAMNEALSGLSTGIAKALAASKGQP